jgi:hypothetical protein
LLLLDNQEARLASFPVDAEVLHASHLLVCDVVDVEPKDVLPTLFEAQLRLA